MLERWLDFNRSMTTGTTATTRLSTAPVVHAVQPRFDPPPITNLSTATPPPLALRQNAVTVSMARTTLLVIGSRKGQVSSPVLRYLSQVYAMIASSERFLVSPANING